MLQDPRPRCSTMWMPVGLQLDPILGSVFREFSHASTLIDQSILTVSREHSCKARPAMMTNGQCFLSSRTWPGCSSRCRCGMEPGRPATSAWTQASTTATL